MLKVLSKIPKLPALAGVFTIVFLFASALGLSVARQPNTNTKEEALQLIFSEYPEIKDQGLGQYYFFEQVGSAWYVAIGYGGSGLMIVNGDCFKVIGSTVDYTNSLQKSSSDITKINAVTCEGI
ncbi:hypothetical protein KC669_01465 [Candidatus Dojkabacteria bacterium]|uniref:Uncharacterized protein n=1 Tax=Candidatus Dojkabacteria bacterium TaxID=2099670 RepID=A0A955RLU0_9BACT|nr:hypothetical protein [Candidatus Dojkabacteria bacterium]